MSTPNFENLLRVLRREVPDRPTLFEFFLNHRLHTKLVGTDVFEDGKNAYQKFTVNAFKNAGYDYVTLHGSNFSFPTGEIHQQKTRSLNEGGLISDRESFEAYQWPDPDSFDYSMLDEIRTSLPDGMKIIVCGPNGVLENTINLVGYENLCCMIFEDPGLTADIFDAVGSRLLKYYQNCLKYDTVGAIISNDDWGYKTQTMLSPDDMRRYVFPWHKKIVAAAHTEGKPVILHSCGNLEKVMDDIIDDMKFDAKHSYEDTIVPVEDAYERWGNRIAILGGMDVDFICRSSLDEIKTRCNAMLKRTECRGGYALGTGNSVPEYIPDENYFAMASVIMDGRK